MKVLLDSCVWGGVLKNIAVAGHDVDWAGNWPKDPGDTQILATAHRQKRVLVTLDKDFGELAILRGQKHSGIVRLVDFPARMQAKALLQILASYENELRAGAIVTASPIRVRIRSSN